MCELNRDAADALRPFAPNAVTDVTGLRAARPRPRDGVAQRRADRPRRRGAAGAARARSSSPRPACAPGGDRRNREFAGAARRRASASPELEALAYDPQTAGGLLVTLPAEKRAVLEATFAAAGLPLYASGRVDGRARESRLA